MGAADADLALARRASEGDRAAVEAICRAHYDAVRSHLLSLTASSELAEDLSQEAFLRAITRFERYRGEASLRTWLLGIAFNVARNFFARRRRRRHLRQMRLAVDAGAVERDTPEAELVGTRARVELYLALERLPETQRQAFILRNLRDVPLAEAAAILDVPVSTVSHRARRAQQRLEGLLRDELAAGVGPTAPDDG